MTYRNFINNRVIICLTFVAFSSIAFWACSKKVALGFVSEPGNSYVLTPFTESKKFKDAEIEDFSYEEGRMNFKISGSSYVLGSQTDDSPLKMCANSTKGQHIHVIVDNKPYDAKYEASFPYDMTDGDHYLLTFLSRSYHESIKTDDAYRLQKVTIKNKSIDKSKNVKEPMIFYSRPKGDYIGEAETKKVMLDFYPVNAPLGKKYKVKAEIDGQVFIINTWQPYYIEGMKLGEHKVKLTLIDEFGNDVLSPLNPVERTFNLKADPATGK